MIFNFYLVFIILLNFYRLVIYHQITKMPPQIERKYYWRICIVKYALNKYNRVLTLFQISYNLYNNNNISLTF